MLIRIKRHTISFKHAIEGIVYTYKSQPNFQIHILVALLTLIGGMFYNISYFEWITLIFTFSIVFIAEMVNTSIESVVDLVTLETRQDAKIAKDVSAGMVLMSALASIIIGLFIFLPKIITL